MEEGLDHDSSAIDKLRKLVEDEKGLYLGNPPDERVLMVYLRYSNYNVDKAFEKMQIVYKLKKENSNFYAFWRDPALHDVILKKGVHILLPDRDDKGRRVYVLRLGKMIYGEHEPQEMFQTDDLWLSLAIDEEETQKNGLIIMFDLGGMSWKFLRYFTPHFIRIMAAKAENIPLRHIQFHLVNAGLLLNTVVSLVFPFLKPSTKEVVFLHKSLPSLHEHISPSTLPADYGGQRPTLDPSSCWAYLDCRQPRMNELLSYGYVAKTKP